MIMLVRHGDTEWTATGRHTGRTDIPLDGKGREEARRLADRLRSLGPFATVLTSPLSRSTDTCDLAGLGSVAKIDADLREWDYGDYEGRTTAEIRKERPGWSLWADGVPGGESINDVAGRAERVLLAARTGGGDALVFSHGHFLRVLAARWLELEPAAGRYFALDPATISILDHEREQPVLRLWNS